MCRKQSGVEQGGRIGWELICKLLLYCGLQGPFPYEGEEDPDLINAGKSVCLAIWGEKVLGTRGYTQVFLMPLYREGDSDHTGGRVFLLQ